MKMLRKSVETRDWLHTIEPRTVRAVMKRVVEDIAAVDSQVGALYEEGQRTEHSSDSSRRTHRHAYRSNWSTYTPSHLDSSLVTNMQKLFSERIEIFSSVDFSKVSILTGIIKISLKSFANEYLFCSSSFATDMKPASESSFATDLRLSIGQLPVPFEEPHHTFLECVRLRTFSRYGLQQIQVDTHYLQLYLWRFVTDEKCVRDLLWRREVSLKCKEVLYRAYFVRIVTHAAETGTLTRKVEAMGMKFVRNMLAVTRRNKIRKEVIRGIVEEAGLIPKMMMQVKYIGEN
uniref:Vacuolar protein sorting-associated protein 51 homolog n=1 Tax=Timema bartmani TaxID=61472 RepID=A0A7R9I732_9NEOP|nr:unnamed protein product [Timema bartmani]